MYFKAILLLLLSKTVFANAIREKRQTSVDIASALSEASVLTAKFSASTTYSIPFTTPGGNLPQPPATLVGAIITAVPASILIELAQPSLRSSIASEFKAGNTSQWHQTLPSAVESYIESLETFVAAGDVNLSATPTVTFQFTAPDPTNTATTKKGSGDTVATSTSKAAAPQETLGVDMSLLAAMGLLGVAIVL